MSSEARGSVSTVPEADRLTRRSDRSNMSLVAQPIALATSLQVGSGPLISVLAYSESSSKWSRAGRVDMNLIAGSVPTRHRLKRSASQHAPMVGSSLGAAVSVVADRFDELARPLAPRLEARDPGLCNRRAQDLGGARTVIWLVVLVGGVASREAAQTRRPSAGRCRGPCGRAALRSARRTSSGGAHVRGGRVRERLRWPQSSRAVREGGLRPGSICGAWPAMSSL